MIPGFFDPQDRWPDFDPMGHYNAQVDMDSLYSLMLAVEHKGGPKPVAIEIGSWAGSTARSMAELGWRVFCVDTWQGNEADRLGALAGSMPGDHAFRTFCRNCEGHLYRNVFPLRGTSLEVGATWPDDLKVNLVFIDADHRYEHVKADIEMWGKVVMPGGILCGHDYNGEDGEGAKFDGVTNAVNEIGGKLLAGSVWFKEIK